MVRCSAGCGSPGAHLPFPSPLDGGALLTVWYLGSTPSAVTMDLGLGHLAEVCLSDGPGTVLSPTTLEEGGLGSPSLGAPT